MGWGTVPALHFHRWDQLPPSFHLLPSPPGRQACLTADSVTVLGQGEVDDCPAAPPPPGGVPSSTGERVLGSERGQEAAPPTPCRAPGSGGPCQAPASAGLVWTQGSIVTAQGWEESGPFSPPPRRSDPQASRASSSLHLARPRAAEGRCAVSRAPGLALPAAAAALAGGEGARGARGGGAVGAPIRSAASSFHQRAVVQQPEEQEPRAPRKTSRAHKQSHVASRLGGPG